LLPEVSKLLKVARLPSHPARLFLVEQASPSRNFDSKLLQYDSVNLIYLDNNATTLPAPEVVTAMVPYFTEFYGNASSVHRFGQRARHAIDIARGQIAKLVGCAETELMFTGGGTEAINTAIRGILATRAPRKRIITSTVEHSATRSVCEQLVRDGLAEVVEVPVDHVGNLDLDALRAAAMADPALISIMWANNETGVIFPVDQVATICQAAKAPFHCDATQAIGKMPTDFRAIGMDAASFAAHKFHGPKGIGALYTRRGLRFRPLVLGGPQERGRRGGTENVPAIVGFGQAAELAGQCLDQMSRVAALRDALENGVLQRIDNTFVNGDVTRRLANTTNISFARLEAEAILLLLSEQQICASAGAACSSGSLEPSHVLRAMHVSDIIGHGAVRFSLSRYTTQEEIDQTLAVLPPIIQRLRAVLPVSI
jgi:cysteine desulfurase